MKIENETDIPKSLNQAVGGAHNAVRLSSASPAERVVCSGRTTVRRPLTDAAVSNPRAEESRPSPRPGQESGSCRPRGPHHGIEERFAQNARRHFGRKIGGKWRSQFWFETGGRGVHFHSLATVRNLSEVVAFPVSWQIYLIAIDRYLSPKFACL